MKKAKSKAKEEVLGKEEAQKRLQKVYEGIDANGDGTITVGEVKEVLKRCGSDTAKLIARKLKGHVEELCTFEVFMEAIHIGMKQEDITLETLTDRQLEFFRRILSSQNDA